MGVIRDIFRRRLRSLLTVSGVAVGVFALVVLGGMAEKADVTLGRSAEYYAGKVVVVEKSGNALGYSNGNRPLTAAKLDELGDVAGVGSVAPQIVLPLDDTKIPVGVPQLVVGGFLGGEGRDEDWELTEGRAFSEQDTGVAVVGADVIDALDAGLGRTVEVRGERFEVVGLLAKSYTLMDRSVMVPLSDARRLHAASLPRTFALGAAREQLAMQATAYVASGSDAEQVARRIEKSVAGVKASGPAEMERALQQTVSVFNVILIGVGSLALIVGGLSIVNTMTLSVAERTREMGINRALGASARRVAGDVLSEAAVTGALGGVLGLIGGAGAMVAGNAASVAGAGTTLFALTARLAFGAVAFAVVLGTLAGAYPAWYAARMDPVDALAYE